MKTIISRLVLCGVVLGLGGAASAAQEQEPAEPAKSDSAEAMAHLAAARTAAGTQWNEAFDFFCKVDPNRSDSPTDPVLEPTKIFDNLYVLGLTGTATYVIQTSDGLVMIDPGYAQHLESVLLAGLAALKLDPAQVKYIIIGHGTPDHYGGARYFQEKYGTRVIVGARDWDRIENPAAFAPPPASPPPPPARRPQRDISVTDRQVVTVGDTQITIWTNPAVTLGSLNIVFPVKDGATMHTAALFGGTVLKPGRQTDATLQQYLQTLKQYAELTQRLNVDVEIQNHPLFDGTAQKMAAVRAGKKGREHPFVVGKDGYQRFTTVISECMQVQLARRATVQ